MQIEILKLTDVRRITGLSAASIYRGANRGTFPKPIKLGKRSSGWVKFEVEEWLQERFNVSRKSEAEAK